MARDDGEWVEVASTGQDEEALLIAGLLKSQGIPTEVEGPTTSPLPENLGAFGMSRVMVPADRVKEAREVLAQQKSEFRKGAKEPARE